MDESQLIRMEFKHEEIKKRIKWHHEKEFELDEQLYDVVNIEESPDGIIYWVFADHEETFVDKQISLLLGKALSQNQQRQEKQAKLLAFSKNLFCENQTSPVPLNQTNQMGYETKNTIAPYAIYFSPPAPPPRPIG